MGSLEAEFERTILSFKNRLEQKELVEMECRSLSDLYVVINRIQHQQRDLKKMMNLNRIKSFLEAMAQFEQTIKIFANVNDKVAFIWGPIKFLLDVRSHLTGAVAPMSFTFYLGGEYLGRCLRRTARCV